MLKKARKIQLGRETVKVLSTDALGQVHGGWWTKGYGECSSNNPTHCPCMETGWDASCGSCGDTL